MLHNLKLVGREWIRSSHGRSLPEARREHVDPTHEHRGWYLAQVSAGNKVPEGRALEGNRHERQPNDLREGSDEHLERQTVPESLLLTENLFGQGLELVILKLTILR